MSTGHLPSSFASAAAGQNPNRDVSRGGRNDGRGSGEWTRRDGRASSGTLTFRRPSSNSLGQSTQPNMVADSLPQMHSPEFFPKSMDAALPPVPGTAPYSRDDLLGIYKNSKGSGQSDLNRLYMAGWNPGSMNGASTRGWGKTNEAQIDPDVCWDSSGEVEPLGLHGLTADEREAFATDINSTVKPPQIKDQHHAGNATNNRKLSHGTAGLNLNPGLASPSSTTRPGTRRRETTEATSSFGNIGVMSPSSLRYLDEGAWARRGTETGAEERLKERSKEATAAEAVVLTTSVPSNPFGRSGLGGIVRSSTVGTIGSTASTGRAGAGPVGAADAHAGDLSSRASTTAEATGGVPSMGSFGFFAHQPASAIGDKRLGAPRGESRLAHLIPNNNNNNNNNANVDKPQEWPGLDGGRAWPPFIPLESGDDPAGQWKGRSRTDTDPFGGGHGGNVTGSAALGGLSDSPPQNSSSNNQTTTTKPSPGDFGMSQLALGGLGSPQHRGAPDNGPLSPSSTNPYMSPHGGDRRGAGGNETEDAGSERDHGPGFGVPSRGFGPGAFDAGDRSQTSSAGPRGGYPGAIGSLSGWPAPSASGPERGGAANFGSSNYGSIFAPMSGDPTGPGMAAFGGMYGGRAHKMTSMFPSDHLDNGLADPMPDLRQTPNPLGAIGRNPFGLPPRESDSPNRAGGRFDSFFPPAADALSRQQNPIFSATEAAAMSGLATGATSSQQQTPPAPYAPTTPGMAPGPQYGVVQSSGGGGEPQQLQMVMPDRMRWVYLDPMGNVQGPFTGLEMHDWYKGNFFTTDLRVRKVEDKEFEPLGSVIRRIGNSREPFLVPQVGVAHGAPSQTGPYSPPSSGIIPPLSGVFPSFGRTLTADEQNNLERRKQEEQFMLAQQRDFQIRQQAMTKMHMGSAPMLQHQSSTHSLHSQPSFGKLAPSMAMSPIGPTGVFGVGAIGQMTGAPGAPGTTGAPGAPGAVGQADAHQDGEGAHWRHEEGQMGPVATQPIGASQPGVGLRSQLPQTSELTPDSEGFRDRLHEFEQLRAQRDAEQAADAAAATTAAAAEASMAQAAPQQQQQQQQQQPPQHRQHRQQPSTTTSDVSVQEGPSKPKQQSPAGDVGQGLTMAQQVQRAQAEAVDSGIPMPFPPAADAAQIAAPAAQLARSNLPEQYSRQSSETPDLTAAAAAQPPPLAPWAKEPGTESQKGPAFKEIQEAEERKAAAAEEIAAAQRRRQAQEQEAALREREKLMTAQAPGLPTTSTWGSGTPVMSTPAAWAKPSAGAGAGAAPAGSAEKNSLAKIQREEELRKQRAKDLALQSGAPQPSAKSYANLAGKLGPATAHHQPGSLATMAQQLQQSHGNPSSASPGPAPSMAAAAAAAGGGGGWSTVGANGKIKVPTGPSAQSWSASAASVKPMAPKPVVRPAASTAAATQSTAGEAQEEFKKWVVAKLKKGITDNINIESLVETLFSFPLDGQLIADVVYTHSKVMNGRDFADEFIRRKTLADKGVFDKRSAAAEGEDENSGDGWNEVVKRGGGASSSSAAQQVDAAGLQGQGFKVVPSRKKGKK